jgi:hypothetical protein
MSISHQSTTSLNELAEILAAGYVNPRNEHDVTDKLKNGIERVDSSKSSLLSKESYLSLHSRFRSQFTKLSQSIRSACSASVADNSDKMPVFNPGFETTESLSDLAMVLTRGYQSKISSVHKSTQDTERSSCRSFVDISFSLPRCSTESLRELAVKLTKGFQPEDKSTRGSIISKNSESQASLEEFGIKLAGGYQGGNDVVRPLSRLSQSTEISQKEPSLKPLPMNASTESRREFAVVLERGYDINAKQPEPDSEPQRSSEATYTSQTSTTHESEINMSRKSLLDEESEQGRTHSKNITKYFGLKESKHPKRSFEFRKPKLASTVAKVVTKFCASIKRKVDLQIEHHSEMLSVQQRLNLDAQEERENFTVLVNTKVSVPHTTLLAGKKDAQICLSEILATSGVNVIDLIRSDIAWPCVFGDNKVQPTTKPESSETENLEKYTIGIDADGILERLLGDVSFKKRVLKDQLYNQEAHPHLFGLEKDASDPLFSESAGSSSPLSSDSYTSFVEKETFALPHFENNSSESFADPLERQKQESCDLQVRTV